MRFRLGLAIGFGAGYIMGSKAGREQYERIMSATGSFWSSETGAKVRAVADQVTEQVTEAVGSALEKAEETAEADVAGVNPSNGKL